MKDSKRSVKSVCVGISAICTVVAAIAYAVRGGDVLSEFSTTAEVLLVIAAALNVVEFVKPLPLLEYVPYLLTLCSFGTFLRVEMDFLANVYTGLDGNVLDAMLLVVLAGMVLSILTGAVAVATSATRKPVVVVSAEAS